MKYLGLAVVMVLMGVVQSMDYDDQVAAERVYCEGVKDHTWPDYRHTYASDCRVTLPRTPKTN